MDKMLDSKEIILENIEVIFKEYSNIKENENETLLKLAEELKEVRQCNKKLTTEISEKDKLLIVNDRKMLDYEVMINKIQDDAMKEKTEKERFDMLKKQDKEIHERDIEIQRLQKKVDMLEDKLTLLDKTSDVNDNIAEVRGSGPSLVQKMKDIQENQKDDLETSSEEELETEVVDNPGEVVTEVVDNPEDEVDDGEETEELSEEEEEVVTEVVDKPEEIEEFVTEVVDKPEEIEEVETEVVDNPDDDVDDGEETEELSEEEDAEVEILNYYKKDYYVVVNESPQGIYMIEDGGLGDKVGEIKDGKKIFYKSSKK